MMVSPDYSRGPFAFMKNPPHGPFESPQGPELVETHNEDFLFIAGAYSPISGIGE
jgi:hypothetical protein